ncbi:MAG TPA: hypothetical protein VJQ84_11435 [Solirubrobacterales bacterium]|nr:hypothetical protein [Solirubrobacterales bacterium]
MRWVIRSGGQVEVCVLDPVEFSILECVETGPGGEYVIGGLADGDYVVEFWAPYFGYATQFFDAASTFADADPVSIVGGGTVTNVDAEMHAGGAIEGRVTDAVNGFGVEEAIVCALSPVRPGGCTFTDPGGYYLVKGLSTGTYQVEFLAEPFGYETRYYNETADPNSASAVSVTAPGTTTGINGRLSKPGASVVTPPASSVVPPVVPIRKAVKKPKPLTCRKGQKKVKRHGRKVCVKKHKKKKHRS